MAKFEQLGIGQVFVSGHGMDFRMYQKKSKSSAWPLEADDEGFLKRHANIVGFSGAVRVFKVA